MKNILYIGPYRQKDGWGQAAYNYLQSIIYLSKKLDYNLRIAPVYFTGVVWQMMRSDAKDSLEHLYNYENNDITKFDTIIQKGLPESLCYTNDTNNIAITVLETQNLQHTKNKHILNKFNHILVPSLVEKNTLHDAGVKTNIHNILEPINCQEIDDFIQKEGTNLPQNKYTNYVKFYFIGEFVPRKNIIDLVIAFSLAFKSSDKVVLFIKTSSSVEISNINNILSQRIKVLKGASINDNIVFINQNLPREDLLKLHNMCDIFICPSRGEAFCIPLAESMRFGNLPIVVDNTGPISYVNTDNGYIIPSRPEVCSCDGGSANLDTYNNNEIWMHSTIHDIIQVMKRARMDILDNKELALSKKIQARKTTDLFTYQAIGDKICSLEIV